MNYSYTPYIILSSPRSGSNYLAYLLNNHPDVVAYGELYERNAIHGLPARSDYYRSFWLLAYRDLFPAAFFHTHIFHSYPQNIRAVGFRLFYSQIADNPGVWRHTRTLRGLKIIHLVRENLLAQYASFRFAQETGIWSSLQRNISENKSIYLSPSECESFFQMESSAIHVYGQDVTGIEQIRVTYETLINKHKGELTRLQQFLGVRPMMLCATTLRKQNNSSLANVIVNFEELRQYFSGTKWTKFFI